MPYAERDTNPPWDPDLSLVRAGGVYIVQAGPYEDPHADRNADRNPIRVRVQNPNWVQNPVTVTENTELESSVQEHAEESSPENPNPEDPGWDDGWDKGPNPDWNKDLTDESFDPRRSSEEDDWKNGPIENVGNIIDG